MRILILNNEELYTMLKSYVYMLPVGSCLTDELPDLDSYKDFDIVIDGEEIIRGKNDDFKFDTP